MQMWGSVDSTSGGAGVSAEGVRVCGVSSGAERHRAVSQQKHWAVSVFSDGETVLTIESNCVCGRDLSDDDKQLVRDCAQHLLAFVGEPAGAAVPQEATPQLPPETSVLARCNELLGRAGASHMLGLRDGIIEAVRAQDTPFGAQEAGPPPPLKLAAHATRFGGTRGIPFYVFSGQHDPEYDQGDSVVVWYDDLVNLAGRAEAALRKGAEP